MIRSELIVGRTELVVEHGAVGGGDMREAEAGVRILQEGGNAVDALVAAAFTGYVVEPASCGVGGYGHLAMYVARTGDMVTVDHYARAPQKARPDMFEVDDSQSWMQYNWPRVAGQKNEWGYLAPAVPGSVAGLCAAHELYGKLPLAQVLQPAIETAEAGLPVTQSILMNIVGRLAQIRALPRSADLLLRDGDLPKVGDRIDTSDLAKTLRLIAEKGPAGFYAGPVAEAVERELTAHGGIITCQDLASYRPKIIREKPARFRDVTYVTANDPVGYEAMNLLDQFDLRRFGPGSLEFYHLAAEAFGHAYADNMMYYGDPESTRSPVNGLSSPAFAAERAKGIRLDRAAPRPIAPADPWPYDTTWSAPTTLPMTPSVAGIAGTSQMAAADREGNLATLCTSLTAGFGSVVLIPGTGIFLNNCMQNFDPRPEAANCITPGKMPIFAVPTIVASRGGKALFGACGSGGYRILSAVLHTMLHAIDFDMSIQAAVNAPRVFCQAKETYVDERIPAEIQQRLAEMGHTVVPQSGGALNTNFGRVNAIWIDPRTRLLHVGSGPAMSTGAAGY